MKRESASGTVLCHGLQILLKIKPSLVFLRQVELKFLNRSDNDSEARNSNALITINPCKDRNCTVRKTQLQLIRREKKLRRKTGRKH